MHVELVEIFRCRVPHRDSWLVATADRTATRIILDGTLGCPICNAEYAIRDGVAHFESPSLDSPAASSHAAPAQANGFRVAQDQVLELTDPDVAVRIAAMLGATDASLTVALLGAPIALALALAVASVAPVRCIVVDAPDEGSAARALEASETPLAVVRSNGLLPVAERALRGVLVSAGKPSDYVRALRANGRLVAPAAFPVPAGITELARDATYWVGERVTENTSAPAALVELRRRR